MKCNSVNSISFKKKLVAKVNLPSRNGVENCSIYELNDGKKDAKKLKKQIRNEDWEFSGMFLATLYGKKRFPNLALNTKIFSLEDKQENCLGLVMAYDLPAAKNINYIEVNPKYQSSVENRSIKRIGEALVSFLLKTCNKKNLVVLHPLDKAQGFYEKVGFSSMDLPVLTEDPYYINNQDVSKVLKKNEEKLGSEIELVGKND